MAGRGKAGMTADEFMAALTHPLAPVAAALRAVVREGFPALEEQVKWNAPSYAQHGEDRLTFNLHARDAVRLVFHCGATRKETRGAPPMFEDPSGLLTWVSDIRAMASFGTVAAVEGRAADLRAVIALWLHHAARPDGAA